MRISQMETDQLTDQTRALTPEQLQIVIKNIPSRLMLEELSRRSRAIMDSLSNLAQTWSDLNIDLMELEHATITEQEDVYKILRSSIYGKL